MSIKSKKIKNRSPLRFGAAGQFNMTPMIDVVFLLIIFFMLICQFIVQENYKLTIPDDCSNAIVPEELDPGAITVSVFPRPGAVVSLEADISDDTDASGPVLYAVRARQFDPDNARYQNDSDVLIAEMTEEIKSEAARKNNPMIHLRADKDLTYGQVQKALLALAQAGITRVQLAAFRAEQNNTTTP